MLKPDNLNMLLYPRASLLEDPYSLATELMKLQGVLARAKPQNQFLVV